jgi:hypothetical protein
VGGGGAGGASGGGAAAARISSPYRRSASAALSTSAVRAGVGCAGGWVAREAAGGFALTSRGARGGFGGFGGLGGFGGCWAAGFAGAGFAGAGFAGTGFAIRLAARTAGGPCRRPHAVGRGQRLVVVALIPRLRRALCRGRRTLVASRPLARSRLGPAPAAAAPAATPASPPGPRFVVRRIAPIAPIGGRLGGTVVVAEPLRHGIAAVA